MSEALEVLVTLSCSGGSDGSDADAGSVMISSVRDWTDESRSCDSRAGRQLCLDSWSTTGLGSIDLT